MTLSSRPSLTLLLILLLPFHAPAQQQIGSFFTAIYLNGAPIASSNSPCAEPQYCCLASQSCAWDDAGHVACCPSGSQCQGSPYGSGAAAVGADNAQGGAGSSSAYAVTPITTTVFPQPSTTDCGCESSNTAAVVPVVTTTYLSVPTSTYYPSSSPASLTGTTTTTVPEGQGQGQGGFVTTFVQPPQSLSTKGLVACTAMSTITEANVGQPVRTVGCLIIFDSWGRRGRDLDGGIVWWIFGVFGIAGALLLY